MLKKVRLFMQSILKSSQGFDLVPIESKLLSNRKIFIEGDITAKTACEFLREIMLLVFEDAEKPIDILVNSNGGEINAGFLIYDTIQSCKAPIRTFCIGQAYSMAAIVVACGNHGRYILPHSELMLHEPLIESQISGNNSSIQSVAKSLMKIKNKLNSVLSKHTGHTENEIEEATLYNHFFNAEECVAFGLVDKIVGLDKIMEA